MDANFFFYSIYDRFIQRQPCACMRASILRNANTVVSDDNFSRQTTKIPYIGFHRTTVFTRARVPNQLVSLIVLSGDSLRRVD